MTIGIVEFVGIETRFGHMYCGLSWDGDTRWAKLLWTLLSWRPELLISHKFTL